MAAAHAGLAAHAALAAHAGLAAAVLAALAALALLEVVLLAEGVADVQLVLLEDQLLLLQTQHLHGVVLAVVGDEAEALAVAARVRDDARVLHVPEVAEVVAQLVLRRLKQTQTKYTNTVHHDHYDRFI